MCGIAGIVALSGHLDARTARRRVERMLTDLAHRGPDGAGIESSSRSVLGARRLSIRGLDDGTQPLVDPESGVIALCNGEIDNHRELRAWLESRGRAVLAATDVAVIPALYLELGPAFVERLEGAFALAVHDPRAGLLVLARDRAGERPLFYTVDEGTVAFASEVAALVSDPRSDLAPDVSALKRYLRRGSFSAPTSPFAAVRKLAPGTTLSIDARGVRAQRYWRLAWGEQENTVADPREFDARLRSAVRRQCEVDVPFGLFLSGGLDSSLIAAIAREEWPERELRAYTLRFAEASYDEGEFAERIAAKLRLDRTDVLVRADDYPTTLAQLVRTAGEPLADPAWVPSALLARRAAQDVKVALVGEGADEILGGYPTYVGAWLAEKYGSLPAPLQRLFAAIVHSLPQSERKMTIPFLLERFVESALLTGVERHREWTAAIPSREIAKLGFGAAMQGAATKGSVFEGTAFEGTELEGTQLEGTEVEERAPVLLDAIQRMDFEHLLAEGLLTKSDRAGMLSGLELRAPFLDSQVLDFAARLRPRDRVRGFRTKAFLKEYALGHLPSEFVTRRKRGLSVPLCTWLRGPLRSWARERLADAELELVGLSTERVLDWFDEHAQRRADHARGLSTLLAFAEWRNWVRDLEVGRREALDDDVVLVPFAGNRSAKNRADPVAEPSIDATRAHQHPTPPR